MAVRKASDKEKKLRKEVSRLASMANKRLKRLEKNGMQQMPSYRAWADNGAIKFSVKGKDYNQLQSEYWRLQHFLDDTTSTIRGATQYLKDIASATGIKYKKVSDLKKFIPQFFSLVSKIEEYYRLIGNSAKALDYQRIFEQINVWVETDKIDLSKVETDIDNIDVFIDRLDDLIELEHNKEGFQDEGMDEYDFDWIDL